MATGKKRAKLFQCPECKLFYAQKTWARKCEAWCSRSQSCNLEIIKHAVESG